MHRPDWSIRQYHCTRGPHDRPFEEQHDRISIAAVIEGTFNYRGETGRAILHPGAVLLGNPGARYECGHDHSTGDSCIVVDIEPDYFAEVAARVAGSSRFRFPAAMLPALPKVLPWLARIEAQTDADRLALDEVPPRLMEAVIGSFAGAAAPGISPSARDERRIGDALRHIESHAAEELDLDTLAGVARMSKYHFLRVFRQSVGTTPYQCLLGVRLRHAAVRLARTAEPVSAIAFDEGFGDLSTFNGRFRAVFGVSPSAWRRRERG